MIVDRASLPLAPAKDQGLIPGAFVHEIPLVALAPEVNELAHVIDTDLQGLETVYELVERHALFVAVEIGKKFLDGLSGLSGGLLLHVPII